MASELFVNKITGTSGTSGGAPITLSGDTATLGSGADIKAAINASGTAPIYACRAFVNFDGTSVTNVSGEDRCTIRSSGNVTKVVRSTTGKFVVHFTTALPNANYTVVTDGVEDNGLWSAYGAGTLTHAYKSSATTALFYIGSHENSGTWVNLKNCNAAVFG